MVSANGSSAYSHSPQNGFDLLDTGAFLDVLQAILHATSTDVAKDDEARKWNERLRGEVGGLKFTLEL